MGYRGRGRREREKEEEREREGGEKEREKEEEREREREREGREGRRETLTCHLLPNEGEERLCEAEYPPVHHTGGGKVFFTHKVNILSLNKLMLRQKQLHPPPNAYTAVYTFVKISDCVVEQ